MCTTSESLAYSYRFSASSFFQGRRINRFVFNIMQILEFIGSSKNPFSKNRLYSSGSGLMIGGLRVPRS